jgi:peptide/nickel transport system permease protein
MAGFVIQRVLQALGALLVMSLLVFAGVFVIGDPDQILIAPESSQEDAARLRADLGLDQPFHVQYLRFVQGALTGELGDSFVHRSPALPLIAERVPATLELALVATGVSLLVGIPAGLYAGLRPRRLLGRLIHAASTVGFAVPVFWVAILLIFTFAITLGWLPASGRGPVTTLGPFETSLLTPQGWRHIALPALTLVLFKLSLLVRIVAAGTRELQGAEFIRYARAKGLPPRRIVGVHLLRNLLLTIVTVVGLEFGGLLAFAVVTETLFAWPGAGRLLLQSIFNLDRPVVVAYLLGVVALYLVLNLVVDLLYAWIDPRVRLAGSGAA